MNCFNGKVLGAIGTALLLFFSGAAQTGKNKNYDLVVYGATSAGITSAVQAARMGLSVALIVHDHHVGGLTTSGLGATDIGNKDAIGGLAREFYRRIRNYYFSNSAAWKQESLKEYLGHVYKDGIDGNAMWYFEPHVAGRVFNEMLAEQNIEVISGERLRLDRKTAVSITKGIIQSIFMESGRAIRARMFVDATYEGDLMAMAGVKYTVGRESNQTYGETKNGVQLWEHEYNHHLFARKVDAYKRPGDASSGLLYGVQYMHKPGKEGDGDQRMQAYCYRLCLTDVPENRITITRPDNYDSSRYELMLRYLQSTKTFSYVPDKDAAFIENPVIGWNPAMVIMPNRKTDSNTKGPLSFNLVGGNYQYPDGDYKVRQKIIEEHKSWQMGLIWFISNDPRVPDWIRIPASKWGLAKDEFTQTGGWPPQLYIREARRMVSDYVMTELDCLGERKAEDAVAFGAYAMDSHIVSRYVGDDGYVRNEGHIGVGLSSPYPVSYRSIIPGKKDCKNLLVPVCLSASHAAYGSIRMEPVFMALGQSAAIAAFIALKNNQPVQEVPYSELKKELLVFGQAF
ncbi:MAG: FAD-dependent oxidoreductase [Niabella sp.]